jgi:hypothetical protein
VMRFSLAQVAGACKEVAGAGAMLQSFKMVSLRSFLRSFAALTDQAGKQQ